MRWEYAEPKEKVFVSDGKTAYFYVPGERQARKAPVKDLDDLRSPLRYLLGKTRLKKEFANLTVRAGDQPGAVLIRGVPTGMAADPRTPSIGTPASSRSPARQRP